MKPDLAEICFAAGKFGINVGIAEAQEEDEDHPRLKLPHTRSLPSLSRASVKSSVHATCRIKREPRF